ncbi:TetR/AcrR family transcriptional regulator [Rhodococcus globerulus]|uniref:TetR/AcrR family transcriptional regulator n=1 Tax=Rhodococcus globerulus TaxID=33008 RepID=UPI000A6E85CA|nr:TetR/AcrR family transcriptional regulator [Rhodococcus globerulus]
MTPTKGAIRAAALLDAAEQVLTTQGNANAAMRDFAAAAGVRVGHLQHYYPTRADLIRAVMARALTRSLDRLAAVTDTQQPVSREESEQFVRILLGEQDDPATVRLYVEVWALSAADEEVSVVVRDFYAQYIANVERVVVCTQPDLDAAGRTATAQTIVSLLEGSAVLRSGIAGRKSEDSDRALVSTLQYLIHGS